MTIKEIEERTGMDRANIRFYEKEGLLSPERLSNGYREYIQRDIDTLLRIKLLRSLHVSLDDIRAVQHGEKTLKDVMQAHLHTLESEKSMITAAEEVCRTMQDDQVRFETLNAEKYLKQLQDGPQKKGHYFTLPEEDSFRPPMHPWRRYLARTLDFNLYHLPIELILVLGLRVNPNTNYGSLALVIGRWLAFLLMLLIEPVLLHLFATTLGKWVFGLRVTMQHDIKLSLRAAYQRTWGVLFRGYGLGIPVYSLYRLWRCYKLCKEGQEQDWDEFPLRRQYTIQDTKSWRGAVWAVSTAAAILITSTASAYVALPPNRGDLTVAEFAENYNYVCTYYYGTLPRYVLDDQGNWIDRTEMSQVIEKQDDGYVYTFPPIDSVSSVGFRMNITGGPVPFEYKTDSNGNLVSITLSDRSGSIWDALYNDHYYLAALAFVQAQPRGGLFSGTTWYLSQRLEFLPSDTEFSWAGVTIQSDVEYLTEDAISYYFRMVKEPQS